MDNDLVKRGEPYIKKKYWFIKIQCYVGAVLNKFPRLKKAIVYLFNYIIASVYQKNSKKFLINKNDDFDYNKIYWVDPKKIQYVSLLEFHVDKHKGRVIGGDWDLLERPFEKLDVYVAFRERFIEGKKWETTVFYLQTLNEIKQGNFYFHCKNQKDLDDRLKRLEMLFETIRNDGYKSQQELYSKNNLNFKPLEDEIAVNIGRNGDLLFNNGAHRLCIVKILNIPKIPVKITVRHPLWVNSKKRNLLYDDSIPPEKIY